MSGPAPFIVTAELPPDIYAWADALRRAHYPAERNKLGAHVTLFHSFAPSLREELRRYLPQVAREYAPPGARVAGLMDLGQGTAIDLASEGMLGIRAHVAEHFHGSLTAQDRHEPRLHITIQNKVSRDSARALQRELAPKLDARSFHFTGLGLHLYRGGSWQALGSWRLRGRQHG
jgi:hypothetical protein